MTTRWLTATGRPDFEAGLEAAEQALLPVNPGESAYAPVALRAPRTLGTYRLSLEVTEGGRRLPLLSPEAFEVSVVP